MLQSPSSRPESRGPCSARLRSLGIVLLACLASGCDSGGRLGGHAISGVVTLDGQPLSDGAILLEFDSSPWGVAVGTTIRRGAFAISRDLGPLPGSYRVRIYASSGVQAPPGKGQTDRTQRPMVERLPAVYNTRTELRANVVEFGANRYRFDLHSGGRE